VAEFPKIDTPCPLKWSALPESGNNFCKHCERTVHNLSAMSNAQRRDFMASCTGKVCVAYAVKPRREQKIVWAIAMAATVAAAPGLAVAGCDPADESETVVIMAGGVKDPGNARWQNDEKPRELPVIVDPEFQADGGGTGNS